MNKYVSYTVATILSASLTGCLDMEPVSSITDQDMWANEGQFTSFVYGVHSLLRDQDAENLFILGELRSDIYSDASTGWTSESNQAQEITGNLLSEQRPGLTNYAGLYANINQINLFISRATDTQLLGAADKGYYLGAMYGLRAFYYFHLLRSWGDVVWQDKPSTGFHVGDLEKAATPATQVMEHIKADISSSEEQFADDYSFRDDRTLWNKSATLMLKAEVYLWSARQMGGGEADARTALAALEDITGHVSDLGLLENFADVFAYDNKGNREIIFALHNDYSESQLFNGEWRNRMVPQQNTLNSFYASATGERFDLDFNGNIYYPLSDALFSQYDALDTRRDATLRAVYEQQADGSTYTYRGCFAYKYQGVTEPGDSYRTFADDYPIYRYADLLLMKAEAKSLTGGNPSDEINDIRRRAYGSHYDAATMAYGYMEGDEESIDEVLLRERLREFVFEGKRWYDLRRFGVQYVLKYSSLANSDHLLWPLDADTMTDNPALEQTEGY